MNVTGFIRCASWLLRPGRVGPISDNWGRERGLPIDRWYIERFLESNAGDIRGRVLEVLDDAYTRRFGRSVTASTVLDVDAQNPNAALTADLGEPDSLPAEAFDCIILTQTLQCVFDLRTCIDNLHRALRPEGVCLATAPCVSRLDRAAVESGEYWRFTPSAAQRLFGGRFGPDRTSVTACGNARTSMAFLVGLPAEELSQRELVAGHWAFPTLITVRAAKG